MREEEIRCRAYEIYLEGGEQPGGELDDWLQAELEMRTRPDFACADGLGGTSCEDHTTRSVQNSEHVTTGSIDEVVRALEEAFGSAEDGELRQIVRSTRTPVELEQKVRSREDSSGRSIEPRMLPQN